MTINILKSGREAQDAEGQICYRRQKPWATAMSPLAKEWTQVRLPQLQFENSIGSHTWCPSWLASALSEPDFLKAFVHPHSLQNQHPGTDVKCHVSPLRDLKLIASGTSRLQCPCRHHHLALSGSSGLLWRWRMELGGTDQQVST